MKREESPTDSGVDFVGSGASATMSVGTTYVLNSVPGVAVFEIDAVPRAPRRRRACSDVSTVRAEPSVVVERRAHLRTFQERVKRCREWLGLRNAGMPVLTVDDWTDNEERRCRRDSWSTRAGCQW